MPSRSTYRILVIEINDETADTIQQAAQACFPEAILDRKVDVLAATSSLEASESEEPNLIVYCGYSGQTIQHFIDIVGWLSVHPIVKAIPRLVLCQADSPNSISRAYQAGATAYHLKPETLSDWQQFFKQIRAYWFEHVPIKPRRRKG